MLLGERMQASGGRLFRWRSFVLVIFVPLIALATARGEPIERLLGSFWGEAYEFACFALVLAGLGLRAVTVGFVPGKTSGRNTGGQVAASLNTTGLYSLTRNPLYLANCLIYLGVAFYAQDLLLALALAFFLALYYERIILAEEAFLVGRFGEEYRTWAAEVPVFFPRLHGWRPPALPVTLRTVLRREYPTWLAAVLTLAAVDIAADYVTEGYTYDWAGPVAVALAGYLMLRGLKRRTTWLRVPGR
jgi:protein-S-isoprenylcysteine O-methyltransferase Ste14